MTELNELDVLIAVSPLTLAGVSVSVHEYTLSEQLQYRRSLKIVTAALKTLLDSSADGIVSLEQLTDELATVFDEVLNVVAVACGQPREWVAALSGSDADELLYTWWSVNAAFFMRQILIPALEKIAHETARPVPAGGKSSQPSSTTVTPPENSDTTPRAS